MEKAFRNGAASMLPIGAPADMDNAMQIIDRMNDVELAKIAKYAIGRIQEKLSTSSGDNRREKKRRNS